MARQQKKLPARRRNALDESLLIRSAESLGRVIGSLQRQLDAARRLVGPAAIDQRTNGHAPARLRSGVNKERRPGVPVDRKERRPGVPVDSAKRSAASAKRSSLSAKRATTTKSAAKTRATKKR